MKIKKECSVATLILIFIFCAIFGIISVSLGGIALSFFVIVNVKPVPFKEEKFRRIVSYNLKNAYSDYGKWEKRKLLIRDQIISYQTDLIGFQEADYPWMSVDGGLPELLSEYSHVGVGRTDGKTEGEYASIFFLTSKYSVIQNSTFWLSETPSIPSIGWDASDYRIVTWVLLEDKETKERIYHFNMHFDHLGTTARFESAKLLRKKIEEISREDAVFVITGDFNFFQGSSAYNHIIESDVINDSKRVAKDTMSHGTVNWFLKLNVLYFPPIDFIFTSSKIEKVLNYRVDNTYWFEDLPVSDHYPVIVDYLKSI